MGNTYKKFILLLILSMGTALCGAANSTESKKVGGVPQSSQGIQAREPNGSVGVGSHGLTDSKGRVELPADELECKKEEKKVKKNSNLETAGWVFLGVCGLGIIYCIVKIIENTSTPGSLGFNNSDPAFCFSDKDPGFFWSKK
jgi:hypothetical protein